MTVAHYQISHTEREARISLYGTWELGSLPSIPALPEQSERIKTWIVDGARLEYIDTASAFWLLQQLKAASQEHATILISECSEASEAILDLVQRSTKRIASPAQTLPEDLLSRLGRVGVSFVKECDEVVCFIGQIAVAASEVIRNPRAFRIKEVTNQVQATGVHAVGIVCLVTFLIGIVIAYLSGIQLEQYGANIFIVDGIGLGMARELAPILAAIVVAGRSGSAFTAQLGTMKLNQEIDAAETMGLSAIQVLVLPRVLALMIVLPMLVFLGDISGILGGLVAADLRLGVSATTFLDRLRIILPLQTVFVGLLKAPVFAFFIAAIACHLGLTTESNARSVGEHTTKTVVRAIVAVILLNALFAILFSELGI